MKTKQQSFSAVRADKRRQLMIKKKIIAMLCVIACLLSTTGCSVISGIFIRNPNGNKNGYDVTVLKSVSDIENNSFYVEKSNGEYHRAYIGKSTFERGVKSSRNPVAWFGKDYGRIPTMNKGERIVFRSSEEFSPKFDIYRFEDLGYTIGICGLKKTDTGRYSFSTYSKDRNIAEDSSAGVLYKLGEHVATIDMIGGIELRSGNISKAGTVIGLEKGKTYQTDIYIGTDVMPYSLIADIRALSLMEEHEITDFKYEKNHVVSIEFPSWFESGYYYVGDFGFVKYIASDKEFSENIDMNIPNDPAMKKRGENNKETAEQDPREITGDYKRTASFRIDNDENVKIVLTYTSSSVDADPPTAKVYGEYGIYTLNPSGDTELSGEFFLPSGDYTMEISGLYGRSYEYKVLRLSDEKDKTFEEESQSETPDDSSISYDGPAARENVSVQDDTAATEDTSIKTGSEDTGASSENTENTDTDDGSQNETMADLLHKEEEAQKKETAQENDQ